MRVRKNEDIELNKKFTQGDRVQVRNYSNKNQKWIFGTIKKRLGKIHYEVTTDGGEIIRRHVDQILLAELVPR